MKFFRMSNGDIVTSLRPTIGTSGIKALRVYDATNKCYCFEERSYHGESYHIKHQLNSDSVACLKSQLGNAIKQGATPIEPLNLETARGYHPMVWIRDLRKMVMS